MPKQIFNNLDSKHNKINKPPIQISYYEDPYDQNNEPLSPKAIKIVPVKSKHKHNVFFNFNANIVTWKQPQNSCLLHIT